MFTVHCMTFPKGICIQYIKGVLMYFQENFVIRQIRKTSKHDPLSVL